MGSIVRMCSSCFIKQKLREVQMKPRRAATLPFMAQSQCVTAQLSVEAIESVLCKIKIPFTISYLMYCKNADHIYCDQQNYFKRLLLLVIVTDCKNVINYKTKNVAVVQNSKS